MANTSKRGFASMDVEKQRAIASKGGKAAHQKGTAHEFTSEEAREAGRKGGEAVSRDREHMAEIGREGGKNSHKGSRKKAAEKDTQASSEQNPKSSPLEEDTGDVPEETSAPTVKASRQNRRNK
jgi:general stress protein YciG